MAVDSIQSGWGYSIKYDFDVDFVATRRALQEQDHGMPIMGSSGESRLHAASERLESALENGMNNDGRADDFEIEQAKTAIDALIAQVQQYNPEADVTELTRLKDGLRSVSQIQSTIAAAVQTSINALSTPNASANNQVLLANLYAVSAEVAKQQYLSSTRVWVERNTDEDFLRAQLTYDPVSNPNGIYDESGALRRDLIGPGKQFEARTELVNGIPVTRYFNSEGQEIPATRDAAIAGLQASGDAVTRAIDANDVQATDRAAIDYAQRAAALNIIIAPPPEPLTPRQAEIQERAAERGMTLEQYRADLIDRMRGRGEYENRSYFVDYTAAESDIAEINDLMQSRQRREQLAQAQQSVLDGDRDRDVDADDVAILADKIDTNRDGRIDANELARLNNGDYSQIARVLKDANINLDGVQNSTQSDQAYMLGEMNAALANRAQQQRASVQGRG